MFNCCANRWKWQFDVPDRMSFEGIGSGSIDLRSIFRVYDSTHDRFRSISPGYLGNLNHSTRLQSHRPHHLHNRNISISLIVSWSNWDLTSKLWSPCVRDEGGVWVISEWDVWEGTCVYHVIRERFHFPPLHPSVIVIYHEEPLSAPNSFSNSINHFQIHHKSTWHLASEIKSENPNNHPSLAISQIAFKSQRNWVKPSRQPNSVLLENMIQTKTDHHLKDRQTLLRKSVQKQNEQNVN